MTPLDDLISVLKAATDGSPDLDERVFEHVVGRDVEHFDYVSQAIRPYTRSIDSALTLVPAGAVWHVMNDYGLPGRAKIVPSGKTIYDSNIYDAENFDDGPILFQGDGETPALALVIAALRARKAQEERA